MKKQYTCVAAVAVALICLACMVTRLNRNHSEIEYGEANELAGKKVIFFGDSLCAGKTVEVKSREYGYGWGGIIGEKNGMDWENYGRNGAVVTVIKGQDRILSQQLEAALKNRKKVDYIIFEGGCNDADQLKSDPEKLGKISEGFNDFDCTTFTGAFESLILQMLTAYPDAKIGYVVPPKMGEGPYDGENNIRRQYFERAIQICEKWGIPYLDLWNDNPMNPELEIYYQTHISKEEAGEKGLFYTDSQHLTLRGYQRIVTQIEAFMREL